MIEKARLPEGIQALVAPWCWSTNECSAWWDHIWKGQTGGLDASKMFQFLQPRPNHFDSTVRTEIGDDAELSYPPESLHYARRQAVRTHVRDLGVCPDHLPYFKPSEVY